jgi:hypothetical protein
MQVSAFEYYLAVFYGSDVTLESSVWKCHICAGIREVLDISPPSLTLKCQSLFLHKFH